MAEVIVNLPKRPAFGARGRAIKVGLNSYEVLRFPTRAIHQYDVTIGKDEKRALIRKVWYSEAVQSQFGEARPTVLFDGNKLAWSVIPLPFGQRVTITVDLDAGDTRPRRTQRDNKFKVVIALARTVPLQTVDAFVKGTYAMDNDVLAGINFFDHLLRETPAKNFVAIKRSFFQQAGSRAMERGVEAWKGIFQSVRATQGGRLTINVDVATTVFWSQGCVLDTALRYLKFNSAEDLASRLSGAGAGSPIHRELKKLRRIAFFCKHRNRDQETRKTYVIDGFEDSAINYTFDFKRANNEGGFTTIKTNVNDYFLKQYNIRLKYPRLPLIKTKKKGEVFPMELCFVVEGQRYPFKLDERQTSDMIKFCVQRPQMRATQIAQSVSKLDWAKDPVLQKYGMTISSKMIESKARILPPPKLQYGVGSPSGAEFTPQGGQWDLRGKKFARISNPVKSWGVMVYGSTGALDERTVKEWVRVFIKVYGNHGGVIELKEPPIMYADPRKAPGTNVFELYKKAGNQAQMKPQILFFILFGKSTFPYELLKAYCDIQIGVPSQCMQKNHVQQMKEQYCSNVAMKVNAKMGGSSIFIQKEDHPLFGQDASVMMGADVSHPAPGSTRPSFASMVGSIDLQATRYAAIANSNGFRVETITTKNMMKFVCTLLRAFKAATNKIPGRIFYFRDGVSEGEYARIIKEELHDMREACHVLQNDYNPKITITICSKRHHSRFFPPERANQDRNGNCLPGTIVERDITHPTEYDFYLAAHNAIQGTARPVHYHVIHDENHMPVDRFQALIYNTCYTWCRATTAVSLVPAAYYAHLASSRARAHEPSTDDTQTVTTSNSGSRLPPTEVPDIPSLHDNLKHAMWFV